MAYFNDGCDGCVSRNILPTKKPCSICGNRFESKYEPTPQTMIGDLNKELKRINARLEALEAI